MKNAIFYALSLVGITLVLPPFLWSFMTPMIPFFTFLYFMMGALLSVGPAVKFLTGPKLTWIEMVQLVMGFMMISLPKIMDIEESAIPFWE